MKKSYSLFLSFMLFCVFSVSAQVLYTGGSCLKQLAGSQTSLTFYNAGNSLVTLTNSTNINNGNANQYATFSMPGALPVLANPAYVTIKDAQFFYEGGTKAGFIIGVSPSTLTPTWRAAVSIETYRNGVKKDGFQLNNISKVTINSFPLEGANNRVAVYITTTVGSDYDEIRLVSNNSSGVNTGDIKIYSAISAGAGCSDGRQVLTSDQAAPNKGALQASRTGTFGVVCIGQSMSGTANVVDASLANFATHTPAILSVGCGARISVHNNGATPFPAGTFAGFEISRQGTVLDISILNAITINLYKSGTLVQNSSSQNILKVGVLSPLSGNASIGFTSTVEFDEIQIVFDAGLISASLGGTYNIYYAFVRRDDDNDGIPDLLEACGAQDDAIDANGNGVPDACDVLPLKLLSFDAKLNGRLVDINWKTAEEEGLTGFEVERLDAAGKFVSIANVAATNGGKQTKTYHLTDAKLPNTEKLYYRLKVNDKDGKISYSEVATVLNKMSSVAERYVISPNPVTGNELYLQTYTKDIQKLEIAIYDMSGAKKMTNTFNVLDGSNRIPINVGNIGTGNYILTIKEGAQNYSLKFIKK